MSRTVAPLHSCLLTLPLTIAILSCSTIITAFTPHKLSTSHSHQVLGVNSISFLGREGTSTSLASTAEKVTNETKGKQLGIPDKQNGKKNGKISRRKNRGGKGKSRTNGAKPPNKIKKEKGAVTSMLDTSIGKKKTKGTDLKPLSSLKLGFKINGVISGFTEFGAFVKIDYDLKQKNSPGYGLLHVSQIREEKVTDIKKLFRIGQKVKNVRVISINYAKGEVGLSLRPQRQKRTALSEIVVGSEMKGTVSKVMQYGAFVDVGARVNALLHISRISQRKIDNVRSWVSEGDKVSVHIIGKDEKKKTLAASMLDEDADAYLDRQTKQKERMMKKVQDEKLNKSELDYFEDAVRDLEEVFGTWKSPE